MALAAPWPQSNSREARPPSDAQVAVIGAAGVCAAAIACLAAATGDRVDDPAIRAALFVWVIVPYIFAGLVAWRRRPDSRFGILMIVAGFGLFCSSLYSANGALPYTIGVACDLLPAVIFMHVFLAYPSGVLEWWVERALVIAGYVVALGLQLVGMALGGFGPDNLLEITARPGTASDLLTFQLYVLGALCVAAIPVLLVGRRARRIHGRAPSLLVDSFALGLLMLAFLFLSAATNAVDADTFVTVRRLTFVVVGLAPFAFLIGLLRSRLARSAVADLVVRLRSDPSPADVRDALARALRDPDLTLAYWLPEFGAWSGADGKPVALPTSDDGRVATVIERDGAPIAAIIHDPALGDEPELLNGATAAAEFAIENTRLNVELRAKAEELRGSRARIVEAGHKERQRLERNLHDGAQQRLVALALELRLLQSQAGGDPETAARLGRAGEEIAQSLAELREIARGIHPAVVSGHGLAVALEQAAALAPVPVVLSIEFDERLPEPLEVAAYYMVRESLANVGKYAQASSATVTLIRAEDHIVVEVSDDGIGGADTERGSGLRGLADRMEALGGTLSVWSPSGGGTRVRAEMPCEP